MIRAGFLASQTSRRPHRWKPVGKLSALVLVVFENGPGLGPALLFLTIWDGDIIGSLDVGRWFYEQRESGLSS